MSSYTELSLTDFSFAHHLKMMMLNKPRVWLVMFYMPNCTACKSSKDSVFQIANQYSSKISFGRINVTHPNNNRMIKESSSTKTPIKKVPSFIVYNEGSPINFYNGNYTSEKLHRLITMALEKISEQGNNHFMATGAQAGVRQPMQSSSDRVYAPAPAGGVNLSAVPNIMTPYNRPWKQD